MPEEHDKLDVDDTDNYYVLSEDAFNLLPDEWQTELKPQIEEGRTVLAKADAALTQLSKVSNTIYHVAILKFIRDRLAAYKFQASMEAILELDMLTTAFVATYVRIFEGGNGSGFSRGSIPKELRRTHDEIVEIRNKRYAHVDEHGSVKQDMTVHQEEGRFVVNVGMTYGYHIGGATEWTKIVDCLDELYAERGDKLLRRMEKLTGHEWSFAKMDAPVSEAAQALSSGQGENG